jgi:hypothetical protein
VKANLCFLARETENYIPTCNACNENNENERICEICGNQLLKFQIEESIETKECANCKNKNPMTYNFWDNCNFSFENQTPNAEKSKRK